MIKEILNEAREQRFIWKRCKRKVEEICYEIEGIKSPGIKERVQSSHQSDLSELIARKEDCEMMEREAREKLDRLMKEAADIIAREPDEKKREILYQRYLECDSWGAIIRSMGYSRQHVFRLHAESLNFLEKMRLNET